MCGRIVWPGAVRGEAQWSYQSFIVYDAVVACFGGQPNSFGQVGCTQVSLLHPHLLPATPAARRKPLPNRLRSPSWSPGCGSALGRPACRALQCTPPDSALKPSLHPQLTDPPTACLPARPRIHLPPRSCQRCVASCWSWGSTPARWPPTAKITTPTASSQSGEGEGCT